MSNARSPLYRRHRYPPEVISTAVWLYLWTVSAVQEVCRWIGKVSVAAIYPALNAAIAAGLDEIRGSTPRYFREVGTPIEPAGFVDPGPTGLPSHVETPSHSRARRRSAPQAAARYVSPPTRIAQAMRAVLLASATAATLKGRRMSTPAIQAPGVCFLRAR